MPIIYYDINSSLPHRDDLGNSQYEYKYSRDKFFLARFSWTSRSSVPHFTDSRTVKWPLQKERREVRRRFLGAGSPIWRHPCQIVMLYGTALQCLMGQIAGTVSGVLANNARTASQCFGWFRNIVIRHVEKGV